MNLAASAYRQSSVLPPRGLLLALAGQAPLIVAGWPLKPGLFELLAGTLLVAAGIALNVWTSSLFKREAVGICPFSPAPALVTRGPFALSRNPMSLGLVAIAPGLTLASGYSRISGFPSRTPSGFTTPTSCPRSDSSAIPSDRRSTRIASASRDGCSSTNNRVVMPLRTI